MLVSYDFTNDRLVFKAALPDLGLKVYEVGLISYQQGPVNHSRVITTFESVTEDWSNSAWSSSNVRVGVDGLLHTPAATGSTISSLSTPLDLSNMATSDNFKIAYNHTANVSTIQIFFYTDSANYYVLTIASPATGYVVSSVTKGAASIVGVPDWSRIQSVAVQTTAGSGGTANIVYDAIIVQDTAPDTDEILLSRKVISIPYSKIDGRVEDIEYTLPIII